ncbi:MAG TPA: YajQ family cyclic di-GMP-binding protein [Candidatus Binatia bacterium]|nr:YajQ family cyclic di-GMP-binding protein [Candidatus Binatia bacterium]
MPSFDVVSQLNLQEVDNALNQARKEVAQRYDFKDSRTVIDWDKKEKISVESADEFKVKAVDDVLREKLARRQVPLKAVDFGAIEPGPGGRAKQEIKLKQGIDADRARDLVKVVKDIKLKVQAQIMGDQVRVSGKKRDDLQAAIQAIRARDIDLPLQFVNFRE